MFTGGGGGRGTTSNTARMFVALKPRAERKLTVLGTVPTASGAHCVTADDRSNAWVCDPDRGRLLVFKDSYAPSGS